ncbi:branched-chain amino acid ABC transporter permease [Sporolactobacillus sp. Y61]|jgi:branched-chain amino acid transport system permease protein|uniref:Branched-chain amino acid ABC transporter permease n=1 Tax=Sporolactobacillus sp. Y61 TaxID=3160863 RepID=A0AAU8IDJ3_9BACL|nr:branched-chain amino acid ABC transporter permease [Sporolactobacillus sp. THM19-2]RYL93259.1 branched-chain amino acid ABC transporter permease [Sporolactobacillus sp. THM19-2]
MNALLGKLAQNKKGQIILFAIYVLATSGGLILLRDSVIAFLLLLFSILILYYLKLGIRTKWIIGLIIIGFLVPFSASQGDSYQSFMEVGTLVGIYVAMALGLNIVVGFAGLLDLGFIAFFAVGAYTYAIFATDQASQFMPFGNYPLPGGSFWVFIIIGACVAAIFGILLGVPVLRVRGDYLAIVTLGFGEIIRILLNNMDKPVNITNGSMGIASITPPNFFGISIGTSSQFYYIVLGIFLVVIYTVRKLENSKLGRAWKAVRDNEIAAQSSGIPLVKTKLAAFAIGASFSGMMGVVFSAKQMFVDATSFTYLESTMVLVMVVLGGMGSVPGVILGAAIVIILRTQVLTEISNWLTQLGTSGIINIPPALSPAKMQLLIFGLLLIIFALYRPQGLIPHKNRPVDQKKIQKLAEKEPSLSRNPADKSIGTEEAEPGGAET